jgi:hypothetical protein
MTGNILDVVTAAWINIVTSIGLLLAFAVLKNQPMNARVYYPKWFLRGQKQKVTGELNAGSRTPSPTTTTSSSTTHDEARSTNGHPMNRYVNLNVKSYAHVMDWIWTTLRMRETELIEHAGLDSAILLRVFLLG